MPENINIVEWLLHFGVSKYFLLFFNVTLVYIPSNCNTFSLLFWICNKDPSNDVILLHDFVWLA